jgi:hypothetical protein
LLADIGAKCACVKSLSGGNKKRPDDPAAKGVFA